MRFFDTNWLFEKFGGTIAASSGFPIFAFNEKSKFSWSSSGEGTDGDQIYIERVLAASSPINRIFIRNTNIEDITIEVDTGSGYVALSSFNLIKSNDGSNYFYELENTINILKIKILGSNTIIPNQDKTIQQIFAFKELGQLKNIDDINPKRVRVQKISKLNSGKVDIINKGQYFTFQLKLKSHFKASDNAIITTIINRQDSMFLWINDDLEDVMTMLQEPFRFSDIYKVGVQSDDTLAFTKNLFFSGIDDTINLVEVA